MKHIITKVFLLLLLAVWGNVKAQGYQSYFGADSTRLNIHISCIDFDPTIYLIINSPDTITINNQIYHQGFPQGYYSEIFEDFGDNHFYFREDTASGRLYRYIPQLDEELLLCDMSLLVGDTFTFSDHWGTYHAVVASISYENERKVIHFKNGPIYDLAFYEGVFPIYFPIGYCDYYADCLFSLLCEYKNGDHIFINPHIDTCFINNPMSIHERPQQPMSIYPTIAHPAETVHLKSWDPISEIILFDLYGRKVPAFCGIESSNHWTMAIPSQNTGVYIVRITTRKGIYYEKIFVHY